MPPKIAILHTSFVFVSLEPALNDLIAELIPQSKVIHFVDSDVLATVVAEGGISSSSEERMVRLAQAAEAAEADIIFSACSSLGPAVDAAARAVSTPVVKIDDAMAALAVSMGTRLGVLATVPTTLGPTSDLILDKARQAGRQVTVEQQLSDGAFEVLMSGNRDGHDTMVTESALALAEKVDLIVLAQASMARLAPTLEERTGLPVLASPRLGIEDLAHRLATL